MEEAPIEQAINEALEMARVQQIRGSAVTPFILSHVAKATVGDSIEANKALLLNNAQWAARFARAYYN
jgi:pseudouridine-5'-phosphate glycosidase